MNILIIEDEKAVSNDLRSTIQKVLQNQDQINILQVFSVRESISYLKTEEIPDLIFSDIQLGDGVCFDIFREVEVTCPVIFCTAYDEYAIQAFKANGIDYILKPFMTETIRKALEKYDNLKRLFTPQDRSNRYDDLLKLIEVSRDEGVGSILVYVRDKIIPINVKDIALFCLEDTEPYLLTIGGEKYASNKSLDELEKIIGRHFFRANRQYLISRSVITTAYNYFSRKLALNLSISHTEQIIISKEKKVAFLDWLSHTKP